MPYWFIYKILIAYEKYISFFFIITKMSNILPPPLYFSYKINIFLYFLWVKTDRQTDR